MRFSTVSRNTSRGIPGSPRRGSAGSWTRRAPAGTRSSAVRSWPGCRRSACRSWTATATRSPPSAWPPSTPGWPSQGFPRWSVWFSHRPLQSPIASARAAVRRFLLPPGRASSAGAPDACRREDSTSHQTPSPTRRCRAGRATLPRLAAGEALIRIRRAAICGTDLHLYNWNAWAARTYVLPLPLGHEFVGEVVETGPGTEGVSIGQRVVAETHIPCGLCRQCRSNRRHTCLRLGLFSRLGRGCFAEMTVVPSATLRVVRDELPLEHACIMEPLGIAVRAVIEADARCGVLVVAG